MSNLLQDLRYAIRMLSKSRGFTFVAVVALALGIGANTAIFSIVYGVLLKPLPYRDADRLAIAGLSIPDYRDLRESTSAFDETAIWASNQYSLSAGGESRQALGAIVSPGFFQMLGQPLVGKTFAPEEDSQPLAVLSYDLWQSRFGGDPSVIGQTIDLSGRVHTVVGVMPRDFQFPNSQFKLWVTFGAAMGVAPKQAENRQLRIFRCLARLKPGVTLEEAQAEIDTISARLAEAYPNTNAGFRINFTPVYETIVGNVRPALWILLYTVGFVLLIACANVANLMLARTTARGREIAIRTALGAGRWRIARQLITESLLLAIVGGAIGVLLAVWLIDALPALGAGNIPRLSAVGINVPVLMFTLGVCLFTGVVFGLAPALQASRFNLNDALKEGGRGLSGHGWGGRVRSGLVVAEIALSLVVLIGAGLLIKSFSNVLKSDAGFVADNVLTTHVELFRVEDVRQRTLTLDEIISRVRQVPGVEAVGGSTGLPPITPQRITRYEVEGRQSDSADPEMANFIAVTPEIFRALSTPIISGRAFDERDGERGEKSIIINQRVARRLFADEDPVGRRVKIINPEYGDDWRTVVGVVGDIKYSGLEDTARTTVYTPFAQTPFMWSYLMVKTKSDPADLLASVRAAVGSVKPDITAVNIQPMSALVSDSVAQRRFNMLLLSGFAALALVLAAVGLYGVLSYVVTQRTREIGIRMALGARPRDVLRIVVGQAMLLTLVGVALGVAGAIGATRLMENMLFGIGAVDAATYVVISLILVGVALGASFVPARRATRVDPLVALRYE
jgi:putative ABC transport system permease protein